LGNVHLEDREGDGRKTLRLNLWKYEDGRWMELVQDRVQW